jgi:hypothetical protein
MDTIRSVGSEAEMLSREANEEDGNSVAVLDSVMFIAELIAETGAGTGGALAEADAESDADTACATGNMDGKG